MRAVDVQSGLDLCMQFDLSKREVEVLSEFIKQPCKTHQLAEIFDRKSVTINSVLQRLRLKGLIVLLSRDEKGTNIYGLNPKVFTND